MEGIWGRDILLFTALPTTMEREPYRPFKDARLYPDFYRTALPKPYDPKVIAQKTETLQFRRQMRRTPRDGK